MSPGNALFTVLTHVETSTYKAGQSFDRSGGFLDFLAYTANVQCPLQGQVLGDKMYIADYDPR
jgi:hypothetical protein